ncbi:MAG TPA: carbon-nitrogen hydrolase family protein [Candidatus Limnocylindrales bacterium]|nr:carbon-nitrogen hydrolase family protein [Candidatus Limnocylindrales bacterium]
MKPFAIAGMQLDLSAVHENVTTMGRKLEVLMSVYPWVQMVVFSELAAYGPLVSNAQHLPNATEDTFREWARKYGIWLLPGSMFELADGKIYNTATVIDPDGNIVGRYRKLFPFRPYEGAVEAGTEFLVWDIPDVGRFAISICYDLWFPETARTVAAMGAEVILHPTLTGTIDRDVELAIVRATAAQNQCFVFGINGFGDCGNGRSIIAGPAGEVLYEGQSAQEVIPFEIDMERVRRSREVGLRGLGQQLKSFRERLVDFAVYSDEGRHWPYLHSLGPLAKPDRGSHAGIQPKDLGP